jgi:HK97 family phage prohead protease
MTEISGYASLFWTRDLNDDVTAAGAFAASLARTGAAGVRMLCQHDGDHPVGVWDEIVEDARGLFVRGRIIEAGTHGRLCAALVRAGAMDGLSIGFRASKARPDESGRLRVLTQVELWEVSIVTFPMLPGARISSVFSLPLEGGGAGVGVAA